MTTHKIEFHFLEVLHHYDEQEDALKMTWVPLRYVGVDYYDEQEDLLYGLWEPTR